MQIEIRTPELQRRVRQGIESGRFRDIDDLLTKALDALSSSPDQRTVTGLDWSECSVVESTPDKLGGAWVFRDTRMPVAAVFENLEDGLAIDELVDLYAGLTADQVKTVLEFAASSLTSHVRAQ